MSKTIILITSMLLAFGCGADNSSSVRDGGNEAIALTYRRAMESKDLDAAMDLICWDRVEPEMKDMSRKHLEKKFSRSITSVELKPATFRDPVEYERDGKTYGHNLTLTGWLLVKYATDGIVEAYIPLGMKAGRTMITVAAPKQ